METLKDFFIWYNNDDVLPFLEAIHNMSDYFKVRSLDLFKDAISLPGLAITDIIYIMYIQI